MFFYSLLLLIPAAGALLMHKRAHLLAMLPFFVLLVAGLGLREKVGMDWNNYLAIHLRLSSYTLQEAMTQSEPGFYLLAWFSEQKDWGVYGTNLVAGVIFSFGLFAFARTTRNPWMALVAAVPYLVTVIAMSATRQSLALGFMLLAFARWKEAGTLQRIVLILAAAAFHLSAVFCLAFVVLGLKANLARKMFVLAAVGAVLGLTLPDTDHFSYYTDMYLDPESALASSGALAHVMLVAIPGALYLLLHRKWTRQYGYDELLLAMSILSILAIPGALLWSTGVDRMSLYLYPVPMIVYANAPYLIARGGNLRVLQGAIVAAHLALLIVWLSIANSSKAYVPYNNLLF